MHVELEDVGGVTAHVEAGKPWTGVVVQGVDLCGATELLRRLPVEGAVFLGCKLDPEGAAHVHATGGLVFPRLPDLPFEASRARLYTVDELMEGTVHDDERSFFERSRDARIYARYSATREAPPVLEALSQRLHDHAIDDALSDLLRGGGDVPRKVVAFMGGHAMPRTDPAYADVARCARALARAGLFVISGGGPGAMEAANLGAFLAPCDDRALDDALATLVAAPKYTSPGWIRTADQVRKATVARGETLGVPTWFYGHEPTNLFCTHVAKYFSNALREEGLLAVAKHGVVYAPGGAGTVQEIFMDACQNHYGTYGDVSAMVFLGVKYWTQDKPLYPLLQSLARGHQYADALGVFDTPDEVVAFLRAHPPSLYKR